MAIMRAILKTPTRWRRLSENPILQNRYPIMEKCLNIGKNIGKSIYRSISSYNNQSHTSLVLHKRDWVFAWGDLIGWRLRWRLKSCISTTLQTRPPSSVDADAPCECSVSQSARTHTSHTGCVCALRSLGHGCVQEVKNDINLSLNFEFLCACSFSLL